MRFSLNSIVWLTLFCDLRKVLSSLLFLLLTFTLSFNPKSQCKVFTPLILELGIVSRYSLSLTELLEFPGQKGILLANATCLDQQDCYHLARGNWFINSRKHFFSFIITSDKTKIIYLKHLKNRQRKSVKFFKHFAMTEWDSNVYRWRSGRMQRMYWKYN